MNRNPSKLLMAAIIALFGVSLSTSAFADFTIKRIVRCDKGMDVQDVLDRNILGLPMELKLVGRCPGFEIAHDGVSIAPLYGHSCPGAIIEGSINTVRVHEVELSCLDVTGSSEDGISITGGNARLDNVKVFGHDGMGVIVEARGDLEATDSSIYDNGEGASIEGSTATFNGTDISDNRGHGLAVMGNSTVFFGHAPIADNDGNGIYVSLSSSVEVDNAMITNSGGGGIAVYDGSVIFVENTEIADSGRLGPGSGIFMRRNATATIVNAILARNGAGLALLEHSFASVGDRTQIVDNRGRGILLRLDSGVYLEPDTSVPTQGFTNAAIQCDDKESSALFDPNAVAAGLIGNISCPDVDF